MRDAGFPLVDVSPFTTKTRCMFKRREGSNFSILVETAGGKLRAFMSNPDETRESAELPYNKIVVSISEGLRKDGRFIDGVVQNAIALSAKKPSNIFCIQLHYHLGRIGETILNTPNGMMDDGVSSFGACATNLAFWHTDYSIQTMHNNFSAKLFLQMQKTLSSAGITAIPGMEATLPIYFKEPWLLRDYTDKNPNPNGPHVLLFASSPEIMAEMQKKHFSKSPYQYAPCTHVRDDMEMVLGKIKGKYGKNISIVFAHPMCDSFLPQVGLLERALYGEMPIKKLLNLIETYAQGVACFNSTLSKDDSVDFGKIRSEVETAFEGREQTKFHLKCRLSNIDGAEEFVRFLLNKWGGKYGTKMSRNTINLAFASEMKERFGTLKLFEPDSHNQNLLYTLPFGGAYLYWIRQVGDFGKGHNRLWLPEGSRALNAKEFVFLLHEAGKLEEEAVISPTIYSEMKDGIPSISGERSRITLPQKLFDLLEKGYNYLFHQGIVLAKDTWKSLLRKYERDPMAELSGQDLIYMKRGSAFWPY
ncbi:hypothetical protein COV61_03465 [Candidatus Micrarchaeota archaeon CG11_big_fil_rev_8_21_14_0_20_47_5]|nr:MAG: hypothetical protein AUJ17_00660 [Candidatus Micrarchaeota archaeon CG1_02_47_40]PIN83312.1 MAG: hypothetical protein COV61_03465 [Candidatus Micrarchaeota archaeon CG11_big_fil_rev_8_21_14_0_20_47_5]